jgi:hypothetical protein
MTEEWTRPERPRLSFRVRVQSVVGQPFHLIWWSRPVHALRRLLPAVRRREEFIERNVRENHRLVEAHRHLIGPYDSISVHDGVVTVVRNPDRDPSVGPVGTARPLTDDELAKRAWLIPSKKMRQRYVTPKFRS